MNFGTDTGQIEDIASKLDSAAEEMQQCIENIFSHLESVGTDGWSGKGYEAFYNGCKSYEPSLMMIPDVLRDFSKFFSNKAKPNAEDLHTSVESAFETIENA